MRFAGYSGNAGKRASQAMQASEDAVKGIPMGQPIMVGHHSEKAHRKALERSRNAAMRGVQEFKKQNYWEWRAQGVLRHANRKFNSGVIKRRIKKLESQQRKQKKRLDEAKRGLQLWQNAEATKEATMAVANRDGFTRSYSLAEFPREGHTYEGPISSWSALSDDIISPAQAKELAVPIFQKSIRYAQRWHDHYAGLIMYWRTFLVEEHNEDIDEQTWAPMLKKGNWIQLIKWGKPQWGQIVRVNRSRETKRITTVSVDRSNWIADHWTHKWEYDSITAVLDHKPEGNELYMNISFEKKEPEPEPEPDPVEEAKAQLKKVEEVKIVKNHDPDFIPTPIWLVTRMCCEAVITPNEPMFILEPSAGDGRFVDEIVKHWQVDGTKHYIDCVEINYDACQVLRKKGYHVFEKDFLDFLPAAPDIPLYDIVIGNPPWSKYQDAKHFLHAWNKCLKPGGTMVMIVSGGTVPQNLDRVGAEFHNIKVRQEVCEIVLEHGWYESLPDDTFKEFGTMARGTLVVVKKPKEVKKSLPEGQLTLF